MNGPAIALFGEAEKGSFNEGLICTEITELMDCYGNPPADSSGLYYGIQALLYHYQLIFFRVEHEGFSRQDYFNGIKILSESPIIRSVHAICTPGVGDHIIINALTPLCNILIMNEADLYDYLSSRREFNL
jgi:hypothetical protein